MTKAGFDGAVMVAGNPLIVLRQKLAEAYFQTCEELGKDPTPEELERIFAEILMSPLETLVPPSAN